jgi:nucleotide-binding universal stress UspA family protein
MGRMRVLILVDRLHSSETLAAVSRLVELGEAEVLLAYVEGPASRAGLELMRHRPGGRALPSHREHAIREAEETATASAVSDAEAAARAYSANVETVRLAGEPGRAICELAERRRADLVVVRAGGRDRPPIGPGSLGPAARFIADHCRTPVLLLRSG